MLASGIFFIRFVRTLNSQFILLSNDCIICLRISVLLLGGLYTNLEEFKGAGQYFDFLAYQTTQCCHPPALQRARISSITTGSNVGSRPSSKAAKIL